MYLKGWWSVAVWFLLPAWLIKTFNLYVNATWGSYHLHTCTWRKIINSSLMWQLWEFMGIVARRAAEERLAWWEGSQRGAGQPEPARYRNDLMHNSHPSLQTVPQHACLRIKGCWFRLGNPFHECKLLICVHYSQRLMDFWHTVLVKLKGAIFFLIKDYKEVKHTPFCTL